jgi:hypothetical protein
MNEALAAQLKLRWSGLAIVPTRLLHNGSVSPRFFEESLAISLLEDEQDLHIAIPKLADDYVSSALRLAASKPVLPRVAIP